MSIISSAVRYMKRHGLKYTLHKAYVQAGERFLKTYYRKALKNAPDEAELKRQRETAFAAPIKISIVVPAYNTRPVFLNELVDSVLSQTYPHFELCLMDGNSQNPDTLLALEALRTRDSRIHVAHSKENMGISGNTNLAISMATGEYIALLDHDDLLTPDALFEVASAILNTGADMIYSDEDKIDEHSTTLFAPHFKPDFSPDMLRSSNYICHLMVIKKALLLDVGGLDPAFDGSQDHDLALRSSEKAKKIVHIPKVLYHWRSLNSSMSHQNLEKCVDAATRAVQNQLSRLALNALVTTEEMRCHVRFLPAEGLSVTFIISHGGDDALLSRCLHSLGNPKDTMIIKPGEHRFRDLNAAAKEAKGDILVFVDSHMDVLDSAEIPSLISRAALPDAGVVAPTILYKDGTLRHQGYLIGMDTIVKNPQQHHPINSWGYFAIERVSKNVSAASVAFFAVKKSAFLEAGMFDESYLHDLGDVDFCLKLLEKGLYNVVLPECQAVYDGMDAIIDKAPDPKDAVAFLRAHGDLKDAYYSPNLSHSGRTYRY